MDNVNSYVYALKDKLKRLNEVQMKLQMFPEVQRYIVVTREIEETLEEINAVNMELTDEENMKR